MKTNTPQSNLFLLFIIIIVIAGIFIINGSYQSKKEHFTVNDADLIKKIADRVSECFGADVVSLDDEELNALNYDFFYQNHNEILIRIQTQIERELTNKYKQLHQFIANEYCDKTIHANRYSKFQEKYQQHIDDLYDKVACTALYLKRIYFVLNQKAESTLNSINPSNINLKEEQLQRVKYHLTCIQRITLPIMDTLKSKTQDIREFVQEISTLIKKLALDLICTSAGQDDGCYDYCAKQQSKNPDFKNNKLFNPMIPVPPNDPVIKTLYVNLKSDETLRCQPAPYTGQINIGLGEDSSYSTRYTSSSSQTTDTPSPRGRGTEASGTTDTPSPSSSGSGGNRTGGSGAGGSGAGGNRTGGSGTGGSGTGDSGAGGNRTGGSGSGGNRTGGSGTGGSGTGGSGAGGSSGSGGRSPRRTPEPEDEEDKRPRPRNPRRTQSPRPEDDNYRYNRHRRTQEYEGSPDYISDNYEITFSQPNIHLENSKGPNNFFIPNIWIEEYQTV